jgi:hypothetical protein
MERPTTGRIREAITTRLLAEDPPVCGTSVGRNHPAVDLAVGAAVGLAAGAVVDALVGAAIGTGPVGAAPAQNTKVF